MTNQQKLRLAASLVLISLLFLSGCQGLKSDLNQTPTPLIERGDDEEGDPFIGIPNPASFYCQEMGYELELRDTDNGTQGICIFPDGKECEEWDFLAGRCGFEFSFCERQGYNIKAGDNIGTCVFPDGSSCPEYDLFIQECEPPK
jgi:putative hemolysin